ncbi:MAG: phage tail assembly protein [Chloroflexi bacterium]|nr:phage tail assembly protein [Chloroflexota bacterium]
MQTEYEFTLPRGYVDADGQVHREGTMRLATALDEIEPLRDARVRANESYLTVILLSRVITRLGSLPAVTAQVVEGMFSSDFAYLQNLYERLNAGTSEAIAVTCPFCGKSFQVETGVPEA